MSANIPQETIRKLIRERGNIARGFEKLAPHVQVVLELNVRTIGEKAKSNNFTPEKLLDWAAWLEKEQIRFTYTICSGGGAFGHRMEDLEKVLELAPTMCYGFATCENATLGKAWKEYFFEDVLKLARICKAHGKKLIIQEAGNGWHGYIKVPGVISKWLSPELRDTIIPISRASTGAFEHCGAVLLGLATSGLAPNWGVSTQNWMWGNMMGGWLPEEVMTRNDMMAAALGGRYFQFEHGPTAIKQMGLIVDNPGKTQNLGMNGVFFEYLRKGIFPHYGSSKLQNLSSKAFAQEYKTTEEDWQASKYPADERFTKDYLPFGPLPKGNPFTDLYNIKFGKAHNFQTPYGLIPIVPASFKLPENRFKLYPMPTKENYNKTELIATFEKAAENQPFRTADCFLAVYKHDNGYLLYLIGTDMFDVDDGPVTVRINKDLNISSAVDYVTGEKFEIKDGKIMTNVPGGVVRVLYVLIKKR